MIVERHGGKPSAVSRMGRGSNSFYRSGSRVAVPGNVGKLHFDFQSFGLTGHDLVPSARARG
jgi:hypothetical protein